MKNILGLIVLLAAYGLLVPGLTQPMLSLTGSVDKARLVEVGKEMVQQDENVPGMMRSMAVGFLNQLHPQGSIEAYKKTRSILGTVQELFDNKNFIVGFLIMLFSVIVPIVKGVMLLMAHFVGEGVLKRFGFGVSDLISKWSMADVFVIAIIVSFMAANATQQNDEIFHLQAEFGPGFYYFLAYCVLSILSVQLIGRNVRADTE